MTSHSGRGKIIPPPSEIRSISTPPQGGSGLKADAFSQDANKALQMWMQVGRKLVRKKRSLHNVNEHF
jgi:hypothetical protein